MLNNVKVGTYILVRTVANDIEPSGLFWLKVVGKNSGGALLSMAGGLPIKFTLDGECLEQGPDIEEILQTKEIV